jgi:hypothetical protein
MGMTSRQIRPTGIGRSDRQDETFSATGPNVASCGDAGRRIEFW